MDNNINNYNTNDLVIIINQLTLENNSLKNKINDLSEHLKKYTAPSRNKKFYENHKDEIIKKVAEYKEKNKDNLKKPDKDKIKEYNKRAYLKRKNKDNLNNNILNNN